MNKLQHTLVELGIWFKNEAIFNENLLRSAEAHNGWFTEDSVKTALINNGEMLSSDSVTKLFDKYDIQDITNITPKKRLGLVTAGNLPLVGWHDILCGLVSGFYVDVKASRDDQILPQAVVTKLEERIKYDIVIVDAPCSSVGTMRRNPDIIFKEKIIKNVSYSDFKLLTNNAQLIHGDLNYGNVLIDKETKKPIIIDFEDATSAWLSPLYDLALVLQRFILMSKRQDKFQSADSLIKGYLTENKLNRLVKSSTLIKILELISVRPLLIISILPMNQRNLYLDEIEKFIELYKKTQADKDLISDIEALIC